MARAVLLVLAAGCYSAEPQFGVPCDPALDNCPQGQFCVATPTGEHACGTSDPDPPPDIPVAADDDLDGIPNAEDNCPTMPNPNQENEDLDPRGNICDECPPVFSIDVDDRDNDGVGDACDPNPMTVGDAIVLFEGFDNGIPATWLPTGTWVGSTGVAAVIAQGPTLATLVIPITGTTRQTLRARTTITALSQDSGGSLGVVARFDVMGNAGVHCGGGRSTTPGLFGLIDAATGTFLQTVSRDFKVGVTYDLTLRSDGTSQTCSDATSPPVAVTDTFNGTNVNVGLRARTASAVFEWVMLVKSP